MKSDREQDGLFGPVRAVRARTLRPSAEVAEGHSGGDLCSQLTAYDEDGRRVSAAFYGADGSLSISTAYKHDPQGRLLEAADVGPSGLAGPVTTYSYDAEGRLSEWSRYKGNGELGMKGSFRDVTGGRVEEVLGEGPLGKEIAAADNMGNRLSFGVYTLDLARSIEVVYDDAENPSEATFYGEGGVALRKIILGYDATARVIELTDYCANAYLPDGLPRLASNPPGLTVFTKLSLVYDAAGHKVMESVSDFRGAVLERFAYAYDARGACVKKTAYDAAGAVASAERYERAYDALGNWTRLTTAILAGGLGTPKVSETTHREITYF